MSPKRFVSWSTVVSLPVNGLNRGGDGLPKTCRFGGDFRGRISSQSLNRARRMSLGDDLLMGVRTRLLRGQLTDALVRRGRDAEESSAVSRAALESIKVGFGEDATRTKVMLFVGEDEVEQLTNVLHRAEVWNQLRLASLPGADEEDKSKRSAGLREAQQEILGTLEAGSKAADLALFGRMVAESTSLNVTGAVQVAHGITVARHTREADYWTGVDDLSEDSGAGMLGDQSFSCGVFYHFACINWPQLVVNLQGDHELSRRVLSAYLWATIQAPGSGKQHSMYAHTLPALIVADIGDGQPYSLVNAFARPVDGRDAGGDMIQAAIQALDAHLAWTKQVYGLANTLLVAGQNLPLSGLEQISVPEMIERVVAEVSAL